MIFHVEIKIVIFILVQLNISAAKYLLLKVNEKNIIEEDMTRKETKTASRQAPSRGKITSSNVIVLIFLKRYVKL